MGTLVDFVPHGMADEDANVLTYNDEQIIDKILGILSMTINESSDSSC